jgi:anti-sigma B factor antagonist
MTNTSGASDAGFFIKKEDILAGDTSILGLDVLIANAQYAIPFRNYVIELLESGVKTFLIDLREAYYVDSTFIGALVVLLKKIKETDGILKLVMDPESKTINTFYLTGIDRVFEIYNNMDEAKQSLIN